MSRISKAEKEKKISFLLGKKNLNAQSEIKNKAVSILKNNNEPIQINMGENGKKIFTEYRIFTDGSNTDQAKTVRSKHLRKGGIGVYHPDTNTQIAEPFPFDNPTNIRAEWWAAIRALHFVLDETKDLDENKQKKIKVFLYIDCQNVIDTMTKWISAWKKKGWKKRDGKPVLNQELIIQLDNIITHRLPLTTFIKVDAHKIKPTDGISLWLWNGNNIADKLANEGRLDN